jgi:polar amino acid transport system substrate-binding protein
MRSASHVLRRSHAFRRQWLAPAAVGIATVLAVAACSSSAASTSSASASSAGAGPTSSSSGAASTTSQILPENSSLAALVPAQFKNRTLIFGAGQADPWTIEATNGTFTGLVPDLFQQIDSILGITVKFQAADAADGITGVQSGRFDIVGPNGDFVQRQQIVDLTDFAQDISSVLVSASGSFDPTTTADLCGSTLALEAGTATPAIVAAISNQCTAAGKQPVKPLSFPNQPAMDLAVSSGRADGSLTAGANNEIAAAQSNGEFKNVLVAGIASFPSASAIFGFATKKGSGLAAALAGALREIYAKGLYTKIFDEWHLPTSTITAGQIKMDGSTQQES